MRRSSRVWLAFLGVFLAGVVAGGFLSIRLYSHRLKAQANERHGPDEIVLRIMQRFSDRLELTEAQRGAVLPHVEKAAADIQRMRTQTAETMEELERRVARELTPAQRDLLATMQAEQRERWRRIKESREQHRREEERLEEERRAGKADPATLVAPPEPAKPTEPTPGQ